MRLGNLVHPLFSAYSESKTQITYVQVNSLVCNVSNNKISKTNTKSGPQLLNGE